VLEKLVGLFPSGSVEMSNALFALLFNFSFEQNCRRRMVNAGMVNFVAPSIACKSCGRWISQIYGSGRVVESGGEWWRVVVSGGEWWCGGEWW
jgi:hypothetical protein